MKKIHDTIDFLSCMFFLYFVGVLIVSILSFFIKNELIRTIISLTVPLLLCRRRFVNCINRYLHGLFGFRK